MSRTATDSPALPHDSAGFALLALATVAAYLTSFNGVFQFDDWAVIVEEPRVHSLAAWWQSMPGIRPLLKLSYALNWQSGHGIAGFHAVNLGLHVANACLVLALLRRLAARLGYAATLAPLAAALLFALHPAQTEAVTYISGRSSSLSATFALASLWCLDIGRDAPRPVLRRWLSWCVSPLLFLLALGTKETTMVVPAAVVLLVLCDARRRVRWREALAAAVPHGLALTVAALLAATLPRYWMLLESSLTAREPGVNLLSQLHAVAWLVGQLVMPWRLNADPMLGVVSAWTPATAALALLYATLLAVGCAALRRRPGLAFGILWFFLWLAPTNSLLPRLDLANDRQLYVALIGPAWLAGLLAVRAMASASRPRRIALGAALAALLLGLAAATAQRNTLYASEIAFWTDVAAKSPANARAAGNLGYALARAGHPVEAEAQFRRALALDPQYTRAAINLMLLQDGTLE